jgi:predicted porin
MNKKILTLAVAGAIVGGMGVAQADVTVYGKAHVSWDYMQNDTATAGAQDVFSFVSDNSSRIGVRASEDLGGGMKSIFQVEIAARTDESSALSSNRNSYLGLSGGFGTIMLGKYDSPFKDVGRIADLFNERIGDARNVIGNGGNTNTWDRRVADMVRYASPTFAGVTVVAQYSGADSATGGGEQGSAGVFWKAGGASVGAAYDVQSIITPGVGATEEFESGLRLAGTYNFGMFQVGGLVEQLVDIDGVSGADRNAYGVSGSVTLAEKHVIKAQYYVAGELDTVAESGGSLFAVGYDHKFSKTTTGYVAYAQASNDSGIATYVPSSSNGGHGEAVTTTAGGSPSAVSVGLEMVF